MIKTNPEVSVVIPLFNEETGIKGLLDKLIELKFHELFEVIIINDGSTDNSLEAVKKFPVKVYSHSVNKGYGAAIKTGIRKARCERIVILDSDGQHDPADIPQFVKMLDDYEMVIGTRDKDSFQVRNRQVGKRVIRWVGQYLVEQKLPDYNSGYRGFHKELIKGMLHIMPNGFSFSTTSTSSIIS